MFRKDLTFESSGVNCAAWLYLPDTAAPHPVVVMAHGFAGVRQLRLDAYAERFAAAGMAVLLFDYRCFGASQGEPRQMLDISDQLDDWRAAVAFVRSLTEIDHSRVAVWGTSLSGGHVLAIAADDHALAACVAQNPHTDGVATLLAIPPLQIARLLAAGLRDQARRLSRRKPYHVHVVGTPGKLAAMTTIDAEPGYRALVPAGFIWNDRVAARVALTISFYSPGRKAARIRCPVMFCIADDDAIAPPSPAIRAATRTLDAEVRRYPCGHFDIYVGEVFEAAVADQVDFLTRQLIPAPGGARKEPAVTQA